MNEQTVQSITSVLGRFATPEVITVFGSLAVAWVGWKLAGKSFSLIGALASAVASRASFAGLTAAILFITGGGGFGIGTGEVVARISDSPSKPDKTGMTDDNLIKLAEKCHDKELVKLVTDYARVRDGDRTTEDARILAVLVERAQGRDGNGDRENKALIAYMEYLKARETTKTKRADVSTALVLSTTGVVADVPEGERLIEDAKTKGAEPPKASASRMNLPTSLGLMGGGLALLICGVCCYKRMS